MQTSETCEVLQSLIAIANANITIRTNLSGFILAAVLLLGSTVVATGCRCPLIPIISLLVDPSVGWPFMHVMMPAMMPAKKFCYLYVVASKLCQRAVFCWFAIPEHFQSSILIVLAISHYIPSPRVFVALRRCVVCPNNGRWGWVVEYNIPLGQCSVFSHNSIPM